MARFLVGTIPIIGHVSPAVPIVQQLVERGHEVCWYTGQAFQATVEKAGARFAPIVSWLDYSDLNNVPAELMNQRDAIDGIPRLQFDLKTFFINPALGQAQDLSNLLYEFPADVLLADSMFLGASWIAEQKQLPWAEFGASALPLNSSDTAPFGSGLLPSDTLWRRVRNQGLQWFFRQKVLKELGAYTNQLRSQLDLPPSPVHFFDRLSPYLYLAPNIPEFEYPRHHLPPQIHFIGALLRAAPPDFTPPAWWDDLTGDRPVVHVTQGTVATNPAELLAPTIQALAKENVLVVATTGGGAIESLNLPPLPDNVRLEPFIPHAHLLPHVDVLVTNGGFNGVQTALSHGVPLVVAGRSEEKPEVAARVEWTGVGINLRTGTPSIPQVQRAVTQVLKNSRYRDRARQFQAQMREYDAPTLAATLLEQLALTKQPVVR